VRLGKLTGDVCRPPPSSPPRDTDRTFERGPGRRRRRTGDGIVVTPARPGSSSPRSAAAPSPEGRPGAEPSPDPSTLRAVTAPPWRGGPGLPPCDADGRRRMGPPLGDPGPAARYTSNRDGGGGAASAARPAAVAAAGRLAAPDPAEAAAALARDGPV